MLSKKIISVVGSIFFGFSIFGQGLIEGYTFESGNRGFIKNVQVSLINKTSGEESRTYTDENGKYTFPLSADTEYILNLSHDLFEPIQQIVSTQAEDATQTAFLQHEMKRQPGYIFEITLAEKNRQRDSPKDALKGALVEVYNNTMKQELLVIDSLTTPDFKVHLLKGNHYTVLVRRDGFLSKRMEAFVDVEGCILCFEGIGGVRPGVADNLTENNNQGTLLANVELDRSTEGKMVIATNIYYDLNDHSIKPRAATELDKIARFLKDNPQITVELGSHTDSRGGDEFNMLLSKRRSVSAVGYLVNEAGVPFSLIVAQGYGESQLVNRCSDGVNCSGTEHARNRRTELKILNAENIRRFKPLSEIKREEQFEEVLKEIQFGSQIKVSSENQLPETEK